MTPEHKELARHALGLPNSRRKSYRNHFVAGPGHIDFDHWREMVANGDAKEYAPSALTGGDHCFTLTKQGAESALLAGEKLNKEDFK